MILICINASAQITFQKTYGGSNIDEGHSVQQTTNGGYIIAGTTDSYGTGYKDFYLIKLNAFGDALFTKTYGMYPFTNEIGVFVQQTTDGGFIIIGDTDIDPSHDAYLIKTDSFGNAISGGLFGGWQGGQSKGKCVQQTTDGGYIFTGYTAYNLLPTGSGISIIKTDANGIQTWNWIFDYANNEEGHSIKQTADGGYIITGETYSFGAGGKDIFLIKTNNGGTLLWSKTYGGLNDDSGNSVLQTTDGGYIIAGTTNSFGSGLTDIFVIKTNSTGDTLWAKTYGGSNNDSGYSIHQTSDGGYIILGSTNSFGGGNSDVYLIKINNLGAVSWSKTFGSGYDEFGYSAQQTLDGGYIITGSWNAVNNDVYLIKTDINGHSGCNSEGNAVTLSTYSNPSVDTTLFYERDYGGTAGYGPPLMGSGAITTTICFSTSINEIGNNNELEISPNPSTGIFTIHSEGVKIKQIKITNILGEIVYQSTTQNERTTIDLSKEAEGIYFVQLQSGDKIISKKIVKE